MVVNGTSGVLKGNNSNFSKVISYRTVLFTHSNVFRCNCYEMSLLYLISFYLTEFEHLPQFCFCLHNFHSFFFFLPGKNALQFASGPLRIAFMQFLTVYEHKSHCSHKSTINF